MRWLRIICLRRYDAPMGSSAGRSVRMEVRIELKPGVLDAEAESVEKSLTLLGMPTIPKVGTARIFDLEFRGVTVREARRLAQEAVDRLLANPVIHRVTVRAAPA
jgi:phosphoribosylformylglycinamidine synthase PurS subunit